MSLLWVILIITILAVSWGWKYSRYLLPLLILSLPLEISRTWFPHLSILDKFGEFVGVIYFGRIFTLAVISYYMFNLLRPRGVDQFLKNARDSLVETFRSPLFLALGSYILWGAFSAIWSLDRLQTAVGVARLALLWFLGAAVYDLIRRREGLITVPVTFAVISTALAGIGIYELFSSHYIWLADIYQPISRINATFVDANIYARFLIIGCLATAILMLNTSKTGKLIGALALLLQIAALLGTGSRVGWLAMIVAAVGLAVLVRRRAVVLTVVGAMALLVTSILLNNGLLMRVLEVSQNFWAAATARQYLIVSGLEMFRQNPWAGLGLGGFQHSMLTTYASQVVNGISLSHTALVTTAAELGIIGLGILTVFLVYVYAGLHRARLALRFSDRQFIDTQLYYQEIFAVLAITTIFISAQGEGRFFEDPYLWILVGYLTAVRKLKEVS